MSHEEAIGRIDAQAALLLHSEPTAIEEYLSAVRPVLLATLVANEQTCEALLKAPDTTIQKLLRQRLSAVTGTDLPTATVSAAPPPQPALPAALRNAPPPPMPTSLPPLPSSIGDMPPPPPPVFVQPQESVTLSRKFTNQAPPPQTAMSYPTSKTTGSNKRVGCILFSGTGIISGILVALLHMADIHPARGLFNSLSLSGFRSIDSGIPWHKAQRPLNAPERGGDNMYDILIKFVHAGAVQIPTALEAGQVEFKGTTITSKQTGLEQKSAEIYYFRIKDNNTAQDIKKKWSALIATNKDVKRTFRLVSEPKRFGNIIILIKTNDFDFGNDLYVNVFGNPPE